jgi:predicted ATPase
MIDDNRESALFFGLACLEAASESFQSNRTEKCLEYCRKAEGCVFILGELGAGRYIKRQSELYRFLCQPILTEDGEEYKPAKLNALNSDNFLNRIFDENGICRYNIIAAHRALKRDDSQEALKYLREGETYIENFGNHPYKRDLYKLLETAYVRTEDYKNAHLYSTKILGMYSEFGRK